MQRTILDLSLRNTNIWCTFYNVKGHTKDNCQHMEDRVQYVKVIQTYFYEIWQEFNPREIKDCPFDMKNIKFKWCAMCEENSHDTRNCALNVKNKPISELSIRPKATTKGYLQK